MSRAPVGAFVAFAIAAVVAGGFGALFSAAGEASDFVSIRPYLVRILGFSVAQAAVSTLLSIVLGSALALALARRRFAARQWIVAALGAASVMPAIVVVFAITAIYGRSGLVLEPLRNFGIEIDFRIFGWPGILLAHVFLNAPFVTRVYLNALAAVPAEHWRLASSLGFAPAQVFLHIDWPVIKSELAGLAGLVFLLCFTSFAIVLTLGGGSGRATLEVAIFQALKADLDFGRAAWLGLLQVAICAGLAGVLYGLLTHTPLGRTIRSAIDRPDTEHPGLKRLDTVVLFASFLLIAPLLSSLALSLPHIPTVLDEDVTRALLTSLVIAFLSAGLACAMALALAAGASGERLIGRRPRRAMLYDFVPAAVLAVPPFALTAGLFLVVRRFMEPSLAGYLLLPLMNALGALPFAYRFIAPAVAITEQRYGHLADLIGLRGSARLRIVDWPLLRRPLAAAFAMAMALSFGDFGVVALFGGTELRTLPYLLYERLGAYRLDEASALGLLLVGIAFTLTFASSRWSDAVR